MSDQNNLQNNEPMMFFNEKRAKQYTLKEVAAYVASFEETINNSDRLKFESDADFMKWFNASWAPAFRELARRTKGK